MYQVYEALQNAQKMRGSDRPVARFGAEMRAITSKLQPLFSPGDCVTIAITACSWGEGASTVSRELALHLLGESRRVLLCAPLDPAALQALVATPLNGDDGSDVNASRVVLRGDSHQPAVADIADLCKGQSTVADKTAFLAWVHAAAGSFDVVLIDCPPLLQQQSWASILHEFHGILLVVEAEKTRSVIIDTTLRMIEESKGRLLGFVFNKRRQYVPRFLYRWL